MTYTIVGRTAVLAAAVTVALIPGSAGAEEVTADQLYVTNGALDDETAIPVVARFPIDSTGRVTTPATVRTGRDARGIVFTGNFAYVSSLDEGIKRYAVAANGALTPLPGDQDTPEPFGIAVSPDGRTIFVANFELAGGNGGVTAFRVNSDGSLTELSTTDTGAAHAKGIAVTPDGRYVFVSHGAPIDPGPGVVLGFPVNSDGTVGSEAVSRGDVGPTGHRVVVTPDGRFVYVTSQNDEAGPDKPDVFGFRIGDGGALTPVGSTNAGRWVEGVAISPDGKQLYTTALGEVGGEPYPVRDGEVRGFTIGADGSLIQIARALHGFDPVDLAFGRDGKRLYVADFAVSKVSVFTVDSSGALRPIQSVDSGGKNPGFQSVSVRNG